MFLGILSEKVTEMSGSTFGQNHNKNKKEKCTSQRCNTENPVDISIL